MESSSQTSKNPTETTGRKTENQFNIPVKIGWTERSPGGLGHLNSYNNGLNISQGSKSWHNSSLHRSFQHYNRCNLRRSHAGAMYVRKEQNFAKSKSSGERPWIGLDGIILALVCAFLLFLLLVQPCRCKHVEEIQIDNLNDLRCIERFEKRRLREIIASLPSSFKIFVLGLI